MYILYPGEFLTASGMALPISIAGRVLCMLRMNRLLLPLQSFHI